MNELSLLEVLRLTFDTLLDSRVLILMILEIAIIFISLVARKFLDKKIVNITSILASLSVFSIYSYSYLDTFKLFIDNAATKVVEMLYFPTTLEIISVMILSIVILIVTYLKKCNTMIKIINTSLALSLIFVFLCMIEYMSTYSISFDEFSVFTNPVLMGLNELAMGLFMSWIFGLIVYKLDVIIVSKINIANIEEELEDIELPKLKVQVETIEELPELNPTI